MISIENAQRYVLVLPEKPTWAEMVEEIQKYTLIDQGPIVDEYLAEVGELLKLN